MSPKTKAHAGKKESSKHESHGKHDSHAKGESHGKSAKSEKTEKKSAKSAKGAEAEEPATTDAPQVDQDELEEAEESAAAAASGGGGGNAAAAAAASTEMSASFKNFRHHPDMENFYRFIYENDLRHEALAIIDDIIVEKAERKAAKGGKSAH